MNKKYKSIFLDLDDTLWDTRSNSLAGLERFFIEFQLERKMGAFDQFASVYFEINSKLWDQYHRGLISKSDLIIRRFLDSFSRYNISLSKKQALDYNNRFLTLVSSQTKLIPYAIELLEYLRPNYRLYILSNGFQEVQYQKMCNTGLDKYFDKVILSDDIGYTKPHPKIFQHALSLSDSKIKSSIMIGDNFSTDIIGANQILMDQIYFSSTKEEDLPFMPSHWVNHLKEIESIL